MSLLGMTTAIILVASSGTTSLETTATTDAARIATNAGFLLGNAHRCGVATDRVVKAGQTIRELIKATAKDDKRSEERRVGKESRAQWRTENRERKESR